MGFLRLNIRDKKASDISLNVMIIAILCLIVLVVLVIIFVNGANKADKNLSSCLTPGSFCVDSKEECCNDKGDSGIALESGCKGNNKGFCCTVTGTAKPNGKSCSDLKNSGGSS